MIPAFVFARWRSRFGEWALPWIFTGLVGVRVASAPPSLKETRLTNVDGIYTCARWWRWAGSDPRPEPVAGAHPGRWSMAPSSSPRSGDSGADPRSLGV